MILGESFLNASASPSSYSCQWVSQVSDSFRFPIFISHCSWCDTSGVLAILPMLQILPANPGNLPILPTNPANPGNPVNPASESCQSLPTLTNLVKFGPNRDLGNQNRDPNRQSMKYDLYERVKLGENVLHCIQHC